MVHQAPTVGGLSRETSLRRRRARDNRGAPLRSHPTPNGRFRVDGPSVSSVVVDETEHNEKTTNVEAWELDSPTFRGFTEKVWMVSNLLVCFTGIRCRCFTAAPRWGRGNNRLALLIPSEFFPKSCLNGSSTECCWSAFFFFSREFFFSPTLASSVLGPPTH